MTLSLPSPVAEALETLTRRGFEAYAVGGCVRDALLGKEPHDWDITTSAHPEQVLSCFGGDMVIPTGLKHGTVTVHRAGVPIEITTYRTDGSYSDNRHPDYVVFSERLEDDLARRDFTVNAMAYAPRRGLVDCFGGREDLEARVLRCVGDSRRRFAEDALRILRLLRFSSVLGFSIEEQTGAAARELGFLLKNVAAERVREELLRLLCGEHCLGVLLSFPGVLGVILPELLPCVGFDQHNPHHDFDLYTHLARAVSFIPPRPSERMAMLLHDIGKPRCYTQSSDGVGHCYGHGEISAGMAGDILARLRFSNAQREEILTLISHHDLCLPAQPKVIRRWLSRLGPETFFQLMDVRRADLHSQRRVPDPQRLAMVDEMEACARAELQSGACLTLKSLAVHGADLIALGMTPGPGLGELLRALLDGVLDGRWPNERPALLSAAQSLMKDDQ
ncbi:CCA tRNA nucleotidyltransferase [Zongyangia hominis]|uniref:HD domain-containing protein n=1 Tax=Zongyangia hominis TaxID=2763677 RepID=A0A926EAR7_9FIRM|nr:HD domain-containing protein [Zongyangia hominis]MBC8570343.1 HD domain-containing protein [Zongyangia hominis]